MLVRICLYNISIYTKSNIGCTKTYNRIQENYYNITKSQVKWVINKCSICQLQSTNKGKAPIKPIRTRRCLDRGKPPNIYIINIY
jgi:hypothetical protein